MTDSVDISVDSVDNSPEHAAYRQKRPSSDRGGPLAPASDPPVVPTPEEVEPTTISRGADLAREALRAAREVSALRRKEAVRAASGTARLGGTGVRRRRRWSGPGPDDRDPQPFGRLVSRVAMDRGWSSRLTDAAVLGRWPQLAGPEIADHCTPVSLRDGELVLQAESTAWATQLRQLQRQILAKLAAAVGDDVVRRVRIVGPSGPSWRHGPRHVRGRGPRDTYG
jgi:predicted nucleic acid-binding Zn ribbon protein